MGTFLVVRLQAIPNTVLDRNLKFANKTSSDGRINSLCNIPHTQECFAYKLAFFGMGGLSFIVEALSQSTKSRLDELADAEYDGKSEE